VDAVTTDLSNHSGSSSGVHGVGASNVESVSGAQSKADSAESSANSYTDDHEAKNNPHSSSASDTDLSNHANDGTNPHGVTTSQIGALAASDYNPENDTHSRPTSTQTKAKRGGFVTLYDKSTPFTIDSDPQTESIAVDVYTDELELSFTVLDTKITWKSYAIKDTDGQTIASGSPNVDSDTTVTALFDAARVAEIQYTFGIIDNYTRGVNNLKTDSRRVELAPHSHSI
jgi:hypothetical protein